MYIKGINYFAVMVKYYILFTVKQWTFPLNYEMKLLRS